jgi:aromatic-L-amino-acid decarboxylase
MDQNPLGLDPETMRRLGYQTVDLLVDRWTGLGEQPVLRRGTPSELARRLNEPPPKGPQSFERILEQLGSDVLPFISNNDHPGYFAYVPGAGTWPGALGDLIASACNLEVSSWVQAAGPSRSSWWCSVGSSSGSATRRRRPVCWSAAARRPT